jgi:cell division protein FtsB
MALVAIAIIFGVIATSLVPGLMLLSQQEKEIAKVESDLAKANVENARLTEEIARLKDPAYVELIARSRYNLVKPGETLFNVIDAPPAKPTTTTAPPPAAPDPWWRQAWEWLVGG